MDNKLVCDVCECSYILNNNGEDEHEESINHQYNYYKSLKILYDNDNLDQCDVYEYRNKKKHFESKSHQCGKCMFDECNFNGSLNEVLQHELTCYNEFNDKKLNNKDNIDNEDLKFIKCNLCYKKFYDRGQKIKPIYVLNQHKKICIKTYIKKLKKKMHNFIDEKATDDDIKIMIETFALGFIDTED
tara:strand:- start:335 stop:895 length:561 start_codon:yes stop_codon:yes gene_type:complete